mmetsp:Transcript_3566/g.9510  ORF Transcript_3566/g.9510 Transcript_3566/m.9510 type:complete len:338 (-) Transcript_3566:520-1533(-)
MCPSASPWNLNPMERCLCRCTGESTPHVRYCLHCRERCCIGFFWRLHAVHGGRRRRCPCCSDWHLGVGCSRGCRQPKGLAIPAQIKRLLQVVLAHVIPDPFVPAVPVIRWLDEFGIELGVDARLCAHARHCRCRYCACSCFVGSVQCRRGGGGRLFGEEGRLVAGVERRIGRAGASLLFLEDGMVFAHVQPRLYSGRVRFHGLFHGVLALLDLSLQLVSGGWGDVHEVDIWIRMAHCHHNPLQRLSARPSVQEDRQDAAAQYDGEWDENSGGDNAARLIRAAECRPAAGVEQGSYRRAGRGWGGGSRFGRHRQRRSTLLEHCGRRALIKGRTIDPSV